MSANLENLAREFAARGYNKTSDLIKGIIPIAEVVDNIPETLDLSNVETSPRLYRLPLNQGTELITPESLGVNTNNSSHRELRVSLANLFNAEVGQHIPGDIPMKTLIVTKSNFKLKGVKIDPSVDDFYSRIKDPILRRVFSRGFGPFRYTDLLVDDVRAMRFNPREVHDIQGLGLTGVEFVKLALAPPQTPVKTD